MSAVPESVVSLVGLQLEAGGRPLLSGIDLSVHRGEVVAIMGPSGSGKTTLLHCIAGLRPVGTGHVEVLGRALHTMSESELALHRLENIGLVLQFGELLPELTVAENVSLPLLLRGVRNRHTAVRDALEAVHLSGLGAAWPGTLSGGETQRVGIARAIVGGPRLILADEPTGSVDQAMGQELMTLLTHLARRRETALVIATHDDGVALQADRVFTIVGQHLVER